jgi:hypothetical protein
LNVEEVKSGATCGIRFFLLDFFMNPEETLAPAVRRKTPASGCAARAFQQGTSFSEFPPKKRPGVLLYVRLPKNRECCIIKRVKHGFNIR